MQSCLHEDLKKKLCIIPVASVDTLNTDLFSIFGFDLTGQVKHFNMYLVEELM